MRLHSYDEKAKMLQRHSFCHPHTRLDTMRHDDPSQFNLQSKLMAPHDQSTPNTSNGVSGNDSNATDGASNNFDTSADTDGSP